MLPNRGFHSPPGLEPETHRSPKANSPSVHVIAEDIKRFVSERLQFECSTEDHLEIVWVRLAS